MSYPKLQPPSSVYLNEYYPTYNIYSLNVQHVSYTSCLLWVFSAAPFREQSLSNNKQHCTNKQKESKICEECVRHSTSAKLSH